MRDDVCHFVKHQIAGGSNGGKVWRCCHVPNTGSYFYLSLDNNVLSTVTLSLKQRKKTKQNKKCLPFHPKMCCNLDGWHAFWKVVDVYCQIVSLTFLDTIFNSATKCFYKLNQTKYVMNPWEFWPIFFFCRDKLFNSFSWEKSRHFATTSLVSPSNDVWGTSSEIPYWWRVTTQISVVLLIGWGKCLSWHDQSEHLPDLGSDTSSRCNFCALSSDLIWQGNQR